jgi:aryl-alcohol dehydrogenase (NADP+)
MAFVLAHRAVSCALIGASRPEYIADYVAGAGARLSHEVLDRIDAIVAPGANLPDVRPRSPALQDPALRRRDPRRPAQESLDLSFIRRVMADET